MRAVIVIALDDHQAIIVPTRGREVELAGVRRSRDGRGGGLVDVRVLDVDGPRDLGVVVSSPGTAEDVVGTILVNQVEHHHQVFGVPDIIELGE